MRTRLILIAATWAAVVGLVAANAHAQSPTPPGGQFVLVGVVMLEGGRGLAWVQEPNFTNNKVVTVRLGDSVGPYHVTKILTHQVELTGPAGTIAVPLAGVPGAGGVASSAGTVKRPADEMPPHPALMNPNAVVIPRGDPRRTFPVSEIFDRPAASPLVSGVAPEWWSSPMATQPPPGPTPGVTPTPPKPSPPDPNPMGVPR